MIAPPNLPADRPKYCVMPTPRCSAIPNSGRGQKRDWDVEYISGQDLEAIAKKAVVQPPDTVERLKKILGG
jgi:hypothetical protein